MTFAPLRPTTYVPPTKVAADTWVIHSLQPALGQPLFVYLNSMVLLGAEPMIVDTGTIANREQWLEDAFSLVEPEDVRWIFLSHDDGEWVVGGIREPTRRRPRAASAPTSTILRDGCGCFWRTACTTGNASCARVP
jgi:glyoxylase-like metal-dependent hydrolase (beta-lactamase superfamily II)